MTSKENHRDDHQSLIRTRVQCAFGNATGRLLALTAERFVKRQVRSRAAIN